MLLFYVTLHHDVINEQFLSHFSAFQDRQILGLGNVSGGDSEIRPTVAIADPEIQARLHDRSCEEPFVLDLLLHEIMFCCLRRLMPSVHLLEFAKMMDTS